jgi:hypothetical protein
MLEATIRRYQNRSIEAAQVIAELISLELGPLPQYAVVK